jgi:hypothetical protein
VTSPSEYETCSASSQRFSDHLGRAYSFPRRLEPAWFRRGATVPDSDVRIELPPELARKSAQSIHMANNLLDEKTLNPFL